MSQMDTVLPWDDSESDVALETRVFRVVQKTATSRVNPSVSGTFSLLECPNWVNVIATTPENEVILIRQHRHGVAEITIEIPGGMVDGEEEYITAGLRELLEETGYAGEGAVLIGEVQPNPAIQDNYCGTVWVRNCIQVSDGELDTHEEIEVFVASMHEVQEMMRSGAIKHALVLAAFQHLTLRQSHP